MKTETQDSSPDLKGAFSKKELLDRCFDDLAESRAAFEEIWKEFNYFCQVNASESLSQADKKVLEDTKRPLIDPPFAAGVIEAVIGAEISQQTEPVFQGVDQGYEDQIIADWLTQLIRNGFSITGANEKMLDAFDDKLVGGYGFVEWYIDLHRVPFRVMCKKLNFWNVWPDPDAVEPNARDAAFWIVETQWRLEDALANWSTPEQKAALKRASTGKAGKGSSALPRTTKPKGGGKRMKREMVSIFEYQYRVPVERANYVDPETEEQVDSTKEEYEKRKAEVNEAADAELADFQKTMEAWEILSSNEDPMIAMGAGAEPQQPQPLRMDEEYEAEAVQFYNGFGYRRATVCGESASVGDVLEDKEIDLRLPGDEPGFTIKCDTGYGWQKRDEQRVRRFGLMRKIVHIQEWFTRFLSQYLEMQSRKIKGGGFIKKAAFEDVPGGFEKFVKNASAGGVWQLVSDTAPLNEMILANPPMSGEPGLLEGVNVMKELFGWVTGVSQALQGTMTSDRSNVLTENLQQQGLQMLLPLRNPRKQFLLSCARLYAAIALKHLPAEELDRILGVQEVEGMTVEKAIDPTTGKPQIGPNGKPVMQPIIGADGEPATAGKILKQSDLLNYDLTADLSAANQSEKMRFTQVWQQHGLGAIFERVLPGPKGAKIWVPRVFRNLALPASDSKAMASEAELLLDEMAQAETQEGILAAFQQLAESDPDAAAQLHEQLMAIVQGNEQPQEGEQVQ